MSKFKDKIRSVATPRKLGQAEHQPVVDERDGSRAGEHIVHWDGRQDAVVETKPIEIGASVPLAGEE